MVMLCWLPGLAGGRAGFPSPEQVPVAARELHTEMKRTLGWTFWAVVEVSHRQLLPPQLWWAKQLGRWLAAGVLPPGPLPFPSDHQTGNLCI